MDNLCAIRDLYRALREYETAFAEAHGLDLNEALLLCMLQEAPLSAGEIAIRLGVSASSASKVIRSVEEQELISRALDSADRRRMYFSLSAAGRRRLRKIQERNVPLPDRLKNCV